MATPRTSSTDVASEVNHHGSAASGSSNFVPFENAKIIEERSSKTNEVKKYAKGKFLGKGGFAKCYEFVLLDNKQVYASKVIPKASLTKSRAKQKVTINKNYKIAVHYYGMFFFLIALPAI
jgi:polo-like kinase 1